MRDRIRRYHLPLRLDAALHTAAALCLALLWPIPGEAQNYPPPAYPQQQPQNNFGAQPQGNFGAQPQNNFGAQPQGNFGAQPQGNFGAQPQGNFGAQPQGNFGAQPQGNFGAQPQNNFGAQPQGNFGAQPPQVGGQPPNPDPFAAQQPGMGSMNQPSLGGMPQSPPQNGAPGVGVPSGTSTQELSPLPDDDDFSSATQMDYADFNEEDDEAEDTRFFKHGRFFGVSVGMGVQTLDGNRGSLWNGGFPSVDFRLHYWFNFNFAMDLGGYLSNHYFSATGPGYVDVFFGHIGASLKYYFDLKNFSAALSFANPHIILGGGLYHKKEFSQSLNSTDLKNAAGFNAGAGLEFAFKPRKVYLQIDGRLAYVPFGDMGNSQYNLSNLRGMYYTITSRLLLTW